MRRRSGGVLLVGLAAALLSFVLGGCGAGTSSGGAVIRVGEMPITGDAVARWTSMLDGARGSAASRQAARRQAVSLLITYRWLIGEAKRRGAAISGAQARRQIDLTLGRSFPGGTNELRDYLGQTKVTVGDLELQATAELALAFLRSQVVSSAPPVNRAQVVAYYNAHKASFKSRGERWARHINRKSEAAALAVKREVETGKRNLTTPRQILVGETFVVAHVPPENPYERAIDGAEPNAVAGPFHIGNDYWLYQVVRVTPARQQSLKEVAGAIARRLESQRRKAAETAFAAAWHSHWAGLTDCSSGYVVEGCRQLKPSAKTSIAFPALG